jgi:urea carboxylase-associated protein 2
MSAHVDSTPPLAAAAIPFHSARFSQERVLWEEPMPGGVQWSGVLQRGTTLRVVDLEGRANVAVLLFNKDQLTERYNMPDTLKAQHTAFLTRGNACYSDMGRILCSIPEDTCGWHDTVCGVLDTPTMQARYGVHRYQEHRNAMHRSGLDGFLVELQKWGLGRRDVHANLNLFSQVRADTSGALHFEREGRAPGHHVDLRCEMNVLVVLSTAPHPLDPSPSYDPGPVRLTAWRSGTAGADDVVRLSCAENARGFINTERSFL